MRTSNSVDTYLLYIKELEVISVAYQVSLLMLISFSAFNDVNPARLYVAVLASVHHLFLSLPHFFLLEPLTGFSGIRLWHSRHRGNRYLTLYLKSLLISKSLLGYAIIITGLCNLVQRSSVVFFCGRYFWGCRNNSVFLQGLLYAVSLISVDCKWKTKTLHKSEKGLYTRPNTWAYAL